MKHWLIFTLLFSLALPNLAFAEPGTALVDVNGKSYEVNYDATDLTVDVIEADTTTSTLTILVTTTDVSSTLVMALERSFFDSKTDGVDDDFIVLADSEEAVFEESRTDTERILTITVPSGTSSVDIIALGATSFASSEISEEPIEETETTEPQTQCGPGTILKDGVCVVEMPEQQEEPAEETPMEEPQTQCGPGTILKDGVCVLDESCGPGTIFKDGQCVLEESAAQTPTSRGAAFDLVAPAIAAFIIAFIVMIILWAVGKAGRKKSQ